MPNDGYQSGGKGYFNPNRAIETAMFREFNTQVGGVGAVKDMSLENVANTIVSIMERVAQETQITHEEMERMTSAIRERVQSASNAPQGAKSGMDLATKLVTTDLNLMQGLQKLRGSDKGEGAIGQIVNNPMKQLIQLNQGILKTLMSIQGSIVNLNNGVKDTNRTFIELDNENDKQQQRAQAEETDNFNGLKQYLASAIANSPTATALGELGSSLISAGLFKVASSDKTPDIVKRLAMSAVYLEVPQTLMNMIGTTVSMTLSHWLAGGLTKMIGGFLTSIGPRVIGMFTSLQAGLSSLMTAMAPMLVPLAVTALVGAGIFAAVKGIKEHKQKMAENDARIDSDPRLSQAQKDRAKMGAHAKSGAKVGAISGSLVGAGIGAAIGSLIAPGIGTAVGGAIGGAIGGAGIGATIGALVGSLKPMGQWFKHLGQQMAHGLAQVGHRIVDGAKWANEHKDQILKMLKPIATVLVDLFTLVNPFFRLFRMLYEKVSNLPFFKNSSSGDSSGEPSTVNHPGKSTGVGRNLERLLNKGSTAYTKDDKGAYLGGHLITSGYGNRVHPNTGSKFDGKQHFHKGIDLAYKEGEGIGAFVGGKVVFAGMGSNKNGRAGYGNTVEIMDDKGVIHKYHHGSSIPQAVLDLAKTGGSVKAGDVIMKAGKTGYATGTHLDYETWQGKSTIDPLAYLGSRAEEEAKKKKAEEEAKKKAEAEKKEANKQKLIQAMPPSVVNAAKAVKNDFTKMDKFVENTTHALVTGGSNK